MANPVRRIVHSVRDAVRSQLWPIPTVGVLVAVVLGIVVPHVDSIIDGNLPGWIDDLVFSGDAGAARTVLDAVSSSLITVTSLTFSLTVVTLQLASSQFSPRLLRTFTKDLFVQVTLAIFLATFTYSLTVLRAVRSSAESAAPFVPRISVTVSFLLAIASVIGLVLFLAHLTRTIRVETMLENVHEDATGTARSNLTRREDADLPTAPPRPVQHDLAFVTTSGFLLRVDEGQIIDAARAADSFVRIERMPGDFVAAGTPIATVWRHDGAPLTGSAAEKLHAGIASAVHVGAERTGAQDVALGLRQLVDVANKALSPGINDPTTAVHAFGHISSLLTELSGFHLGPVTMADDDDIARVEFSRPAFGDFLDLAMTQPRHYGKADPFVVTRLLDVLSDLAWTVPTEHLAAVLAQLARLDATRRDQDFDDAEMEEHDRLSAGVVSIVDRRRVTPREPFGSIPA